MAVVMEMHINNSNEKGSWASLTLAVVGIVQLVFAFTFGDLLTKDLWMLTAASSLFFLAAEVVALALGIVMRKTGGLAKAGIVTSALLLFGSFLIL